MGQGNGRDASSWGSYALRLVMTRYDSWYILFILEFRVMFIRILGTMVNFKSFPPEGLALRVIVDVLASDNSEMYR